MLVHLTWDITSNSSIDCMWGPRKLGQRIWAHKLELERSSILQDTLHTLQGSV